MVPVSEKFPLLIITGQQGEGKTTLLLNLIEYLKTNGLKAGGIISDGIWKNNKRDDIKAVNVDTGEEILFCLRDYRKDWIKAGNFYLNPISEEFSMRAVMAQRPDFFVMDEIGRFELERKGWVRAANYLLMHSARPLIMTIRESFVDLVMNRFSVLPEKIITVKQGRENALHSLLSASLITLLKKNK